MRLQVPGSESIVNVGTQKQLFIDDYIIETTRWITPRQSEAARWIQPPAHARPDLDGWSEGTDRIQGDVPGHLLRATAFVRRTIHQPQRFAGNPIMKPEYPWEGESAPWPANIMWDEEDGVWKMWYNGLTVVDVPVRRHYYRFLYATSRDGIDWDRPTLGLVKDPAGNDTNIIYQGKGQYVLKEAGAAPSRRYKMVYSTADGGVQHPMVQYSPDGLRWGARARSLRPQPRRREPGDPPTTRSVTSTWVSAARSIRVPRSSTAPSVRFCACRATT